MVMESTGPNVVERVLRRWFCKACQRSWPIDDPKYADRVEEFVREHNAGNCEFREPERAEQARRFAEKRDAFFATLPEQDALAIQAIFAGITHSQEHKDLSPDEMWRDKVTCILEALKAAGILPA